MLVTAESLTGFSGQVNHAFADLHVATLEV